MSTATGTGPKRLLIEDWLPTAAIGVECIRERSTGQQPPDKRFHVWWARRPLAASRAAVLGSLLPADFPRDVFERLLGFGRPGHELVAIRELMDTKVKVEGGFGALRAFKGPLRPNDLRAAHDAAKQFWGDAPTVLDPMAGGGSIPLESARLGFTTLANEYNPVASSVLEATLNYPFRFGPELADRARHWGKIWEKRAAERLRRFFPAEKGPSVQAYIFARTVPCPDTGHPTPLVPDWHLLKPRGGVPVVAVPVVDKKTGTWTTRIAPVGSGPGAVPKLPERSYAKGKGVSLFSGGSIPAEWIKSHAQAGRMGSALYAVALKTPQGLKFRPPTQADRDALAAAEQQLEQLRRDWEAKNLIPLEEVPDGSKTKEPMQRGIRKWADMFSPRQLLGFGVLMEEMQALRPAVLAAEGEERGEAVIHLLAFVIDKLANWNCILSSWNIQAQTVRSLFDRHDFAFKTTYSEIAPVAAAGGLAWAIDSALSAFEELAKLPKADTVASVRQTQGSATSLVDLADASVDAIVVDPPYSDNVQYSELADFFYVWLKRSQGHRRPEWFFSTLGENDQEAVKNDARFRTSESSAKEAGAAAQAHYLRLMTEAFIEARRVLRPDGVLTVMFTHKKQEAWEALFASLIEAGFTATATWPVKTEGAHSLHQAKKNAAQSTVILVCRARPAGAGTGFFDAAMRARIRDAAEGAAERLKTEGLNPVDQLVGSFGPAMEVFGAYDRVRTDTGDPVGVGAAIDIAADAVANWRIRQLARGGLGGVEPEAQFAALCWDTLGAAEFRFNEAKLLGHAVGMDVGALQRAGLIVVSADKVRILAAAERRRAAPLRQDEAQALLFGPVEGGKRVKAADALKVHPRDPAFRTCLDRAHALALAYVDAGGGTAGLGAARAFARQHGLKGGDGTARLIEALLRAAPPALRKPDSKMSETFAEFQVWHALLEPLFGVAPPDWSDKPPPQAVLDLVIRGPATPVDSDEDGADEEEEEESQDEESEA